MKYITVEDLKELLSSTDTHILLDIREPYEYEICSIGGLMIPMGEIPQRVDEIDKNKTITVLCKSGRRAEAVANLLLTDYNFPNVIVVDGGILAWIDQIDSTLESY